MLADVDAETLVDRLADEDSVRLGDTLIELKAEKLFKRLADVDGDTLLDGLAEVETVLKF